METKTEKVATGTERIISDGMVHIPGPMLPTKEVGAAPAKPKVKEEKPAPFVIVSTRHIIQTLAKSSDQNRLSRLKNLARVNRDVAWLLAEHQKPSAAPEKVEDSEVKTVNKSKKK